MKLDFTKAIYTVDGRPVKIITTEGRGYFGTIETPVMGYLGNDETIVMWTRGGRHYCHDETGNLDLIQTNFRFANVYFDGGVGLYADAASARLATKPQMARVKLEFCNGQFDF